MSDVILSPSHTDRYGYYQVGNTKTYSKIDFISALHRLPQSWSWHYNDELFGLYNWQQEPSADINELYRRRAVELREQYDYLVLYYSGGYDSSNMLYAFLENNIPVDEVCVFYSREDRESNQHIELKNYTWNKLDWLKQKYPDLNIRKLDYTDYFFNWDQGIRELGFSNDLLDMFGNMLTINRLIQDQFHIFVPEWRTLLDQGKKVAWLSGREKPMVRYLNHQWIFNFHDGMTQAAITPLRQLLDNGSIGNYEFFYWGATPACADIIIKQCHLLKKKYNEQAKIDFSKIAGHKPLNPSYGWEIDTMNTEFVKTIYPRNFQYAEQFYTVKNPQTIFGNRDQWFFNSNHDKAKLHQDMYMATYSKNYSHLHPWFNDNKNIHSGIRNCISRNYIFGENK